MANGMANGGDTELTFWEHLGPRLRLESWLSA